MATNIRKHNLDEVCAAVPAAAGPGATVDDLMEFVRGLTSPAAVRSRLSGSNPRRGAWFGEDWAKVEIEEKARPSRSSSPNCRIRLGWCCRSQDCRVGQQPELQGIRDINDESSGDDTRFVITLKRDANPEVVLNNLWKATPLQTSLASTWSPSLVVYLARSTCSARYGVDHQIDVITRRSQYRLDIANDCVSSKVSSKPSTSSMIIATIRTGGVAAARGAYSQHYPKVGEKVAFSEVQANHILDVQLGRSPVSVVPIWRRNRPSSPRPLQLQKSSATRTSSRRSSSTSWAGCETLPSPGARAGDRSG